jgi:signal peptidase I
MRTGSPGREVLPRASEEKGGGLLALLKELPLLVLVAFGIALLIKTFIVQAFFIPSQSMQPTLEVGDRVLVSKFSYRLSDPRPGDVVVFVSPTGNAAPSPDPSPLRRFLRSVAAGLGLRSSERDFIKRVIAVEGDTIQVKEGAVHVNGQRRNEPYLLEGTPMPDFGPFKVPASSIFVMGDNRNNSQDSRVFGAIRESRIIGRAFILIWPPGRLDLLGRS